MQPKTPKLLEDVRDAVEFILHVTRGKTLDDYCSDRLLRQAVERNFEIIGEAVGRIARDDAVTVAKLTSYRQIVAFRNLLIHGYDLIDDAKVWTVIESDLPVLNQSPICWHRLRSNHNFPFGCTLGFRANRHKENCTRPKRIWTEPLDCPPTPSHPANAPPSSTSTARSSSSRDPVPARPASSRSGSRGW
jgi:uncharacterized protein with HEPN domain